MCILTISQNMYTNTNINLSVFVNELLIDFFVLSQWDKLDGFVVMIDLTNPASLTNAGDWVTLGMSCCSKKSEILGVLIGNKMDLSERRKISPQAAQEFATKNSLQYFECSVVNFLMISFERQFIFFGFVCRKKIQAWRNHSFIWLINIRPIRLQDKTTKKMRRSDEY